MKGAVRRAALLFIVRCTLNQLLRKTCFVLAPKGQAFRQR
jgi:hypothetical protein